MMRAAPSTLAALQGSVPDLAAGGRDVLAQAADVAVILLALAGVVLLVALFLLARQATRAIDEIRAGLGTHLGPVAERARAISADVEYVTHAVRGDLERVSGAVESLTARLHEASDHLEERVEDFNALLEVVQAEAEDAFLDAASTARGVRAGARALARPRRREPLEPPRGEAAHGDPDPDPAMAPAEAES